ncbi:MAG: hypothetical protein HC796_02710 [Synechococcaceae cyanobacterium RL_1_2]|nr:hypothetical protein [Synechococcaceae cyanobacterium RL_1_2]
MLTTEKDSIINVPIAEAWIEQGKQWAIAHHRPQTQKDIFFADHSPVRYRKIFNLGRLWD